MGRGMHFTWAQNLGGETKNSGQDNFKNSKFNVKKFIGEQKVKNLRTG